MLSKPNSKASGDGEVDIFFEVMVVTGTRSASAEVRVDPASGKVIENQQDDEAEEAEEEAEEVEEEEEAEEDDEDSEDDRDELPGFIAALRHSELDLAALVEHAEAFLKGTAIFGQARVRGRQSALQHRLRERPSCPRGRAGGSRRASDRSGAQRRVPRARREERRGEPDGTRTTNMAARTATATRCAATNTASTPSNADRS